MDSPSSRQSRARSASLAQEAALWLARRDRGLTPAEQDEYLQWLAADPRHAEAVVHHASAFQRMMQLHEWQPGHSAEPNPDLFAPRGRSRRPWVLALAAALALLIGGTLWQYSRTARGAEIAAQSHLRINERRALPDGSVVELKDGSRLEIAFSAERRLVRLAGEAHFKVAKDAARPFFVEARGVVVRAVGTAFNVRVDSDAVEVLVTEGTVRVGQAPASAGGAGAPGNLESALADPERAVLSAGQRARVSLVRDAEPEVATASDAEIKATLEWQAPRLQFFETPLGVAVREFNRHNRTQLVLAPELESVPIGGTFRADNVEAFVRLLELTLDIHGAPRGPNEIGLTRAR